MRYFIGLVCVLALSVMPMVGCSDNEGTGGTGGAGGTGGTGGSQQSVGFAYVANTTSNNVSQYSIGTDGTLSPLAPATVGAGDRPFSIAVAPSGPFAYVANVLSGDVSQYSIEADGTLTPLDPDEVDAGRNPRGMTTVGALQ